MLYALIGVAVGILLLGTLALLVRTWSVTDQIRTAQETNAGVLEAVQDCTQPGGDCFQRGQKQTAAAVGDINRVVILAAACSVGLDPEMPVADRQAEIQTCVIDRLARD
jgi:hypothetical protein